MADPSTPMERFLLALELTDFNEQLLRQRLRRTRPDMDDEAIDREVEAWYSRRPGAEHGDAVGRPVDVRKRFG